MLKQFSAQEVDKPTLKALALQEWPNFRPGNDMIFTPQQKIQDVRKLPKKTQQSHSVYAYFACQLEDQVVWVWLMY